MKRLITIFCGLSIGTVGTALRAYTFTFENHTNFDLSLRIKLSGVAEPWSASQDIASKNEGYGKNRIKFEVRGRKIGFCLSKIEVSAPGIDWKPAIVQWVEGEAGEQWDAYMKIAEALADGLVDLAKNIIYQTADQRTVQTLKT